MLISHIIGALVNGILYRNKKFKEHSFPHQVSPTQKDTDNILSSSVLDSITSIMLVGGIIVVAFIIIEIFRDINLFYPLTQSLSFFKIPQSISSAIIDGLFEITKGSISISKLSINQDLKIIICSTLIAFGGFCTLFQSMAFVKKFCTFRFMLLQKTTHALFSCVVSVILVMIF